MRSVMSMLLAGGAAVGLAVGKIYRQPTLAEALATPRPAVGGNALSPSPKKPLPGGLERLRSRLARLDQRYQTWVQTTLDPWFAGRVRNQQMRALTGGSLRVLSPRERRVNRSLALGLLGLGLIGLAHVTAWPLIPVVLAIGVYNIWPALREGWRVAAKERRFSLLHLIQGYLIALWFGGYYLVATIGTIFVSLSRKFQFLTQTVTRHSLTHLLGEQPRKVWVLQDGVEIEVPFEQLEIGDLLVLSAGQPIPVDGVIVDGTASVDQHRLTGESQPVEKAVGDPVLAATLLLGGRIHVRVEKTGSETAAAQIGEVLNRTVENQQVRLADHFRDLEKTRWPMLAGGALGWLVGGPMTAMAMLGCNFLLSLVPLKILTLLNGLKAGADRGILIKDGRALERLPRVDTVVFDKTGTLTLDRPHVVQIHACASHTETGVLALAATAEQRQTHPIAQAILAAAAERHLELPAIDEARYQLGFGLTAWVQGQPLRIGSERFLTMEHLSLPASLRMVQHAAHGQGHALVFVAVADEVVGAIELAATPRPEARAVTDWFREQGISLYILSGDQEAPTRQLAAELGMTGYFANTLPAQKAERVKALQAEGRRVCFIGDGINDAIALRQAEVSVSLRGATTVATDAAQVVLMDDDLNQLRQLWELARGFEGSLAANAGVARNLSLLAATGALLLPFKFWIVELLGTAQFITGVFIGSQPLLGPPAESNLEPPSVQPPTPGEAPGMASESRLASTRMAEP